MMLQLISSTIKIDVTSVCIIWNLPGLIIVHGSHKVDESHGHIKNYKKNKLTFWLFRMSLETQTKENFTKSYYIKFELVAYCRRYKIQLILFI